MKLNTKVRIYQAAMLFCLLLLLIDYLTQRRFLWGLTPLVVSVIVSIAQGNLLFWFMDQRQARWEQWAQKEAERIADKCNRESFGNMRMDIVNKETK